MNGGRPSGPEGTGDYAMVDIDWQGRPPQESDDRAILDNTPLHFPGRRGLRVIKVKRLGRSAALGA